MYFTEEQVLDLIRVLPKQGQDQNLVELPIRADPWKVEVSPGNIPGSGMAGYTGIVTGSEYLIRVLTEGTTFDSAFLNKIFYGPLDQMPLYINHPNLKVIAEWRLKVGR